MEKENREIAFVMGLLWGLKPSDQSIVEAFCYHIPNDEVHVSVKANSANEQFYKSLQKINLATEYSAVVTDGVNISNFVLCAAARPILSASLERIKNMRDQQFPEDAMLSSELYEMLKKYETEKEAHALNKLVSFAVAGIESRVKEVNETSNTSSAPLWIVIVRNLVLSTGAGTLFGCFLFSLLWVLPERAANADTIELVKIFLTSPVLLIYILPLLFPLVGVAGAVGILFQKSIQRHLLLWCCSAPVSVWLTVVAILNYSPHNEYYNQYTWFERFVMDIPNPDHYIFLLSSAFSSFVFYKLSSKGFKW